LNSWKNCSKSLECYAADSVTAVTRENGKFGTGNSVKVIYLQDGLIHPQKYFYYISKNYKAPKTFFAAEKMLIQSKSRPFLAVQRMVFSTSKDDLSFRATARPPLHCTLKAYSVTSLKQFPPDSGRVCSHPVC